MSNDGIEAASLGFSPHLRCSAGLGSDVSRPSVGGGVETGGGCGAPGREEEVTTYHGFVRELNYIASSHVITLWLTLSIYLQILR